MRLDDERESDQIEDRRGQPGGFDLGGFSGLGGGLPIRGGVGTLVIVGAVLWFLGVSPLTILQMVLGGNVSLPQSQTQAPAPGSGYSSRLSPSQPAGDDGSRFVRKVLATTEDAWSEIFRREGKSYSPPTLVLFSGGTRAAGCGFARSAAGPFYCPDDRKVYIDLSFYDELRRRFAAPGDFAQAYVIAHEVGHHVQNLLGILPQYHRMRQQMSEVQGNALSVRVELQADCLAGVWGRYVAGHGKLDPGDLDEALNAATHIGDDAIQRQSQGYVVPDSFTHGSGAQRKAWFKIGYNSGDLSACDTFKRTSP